MQRGSFLHPFRVVQVRLIGQQMRFPVQSASDKQGFPAEAVESTGGTVTAPMTPTMETTMTAASARPRRTLPFMASSSTRRFTRFRNDKTAIPSYRLSPVLSRDESCLWIPKW